MVIADDETVSEDIIAGRLYRQGNNCQQQFLPNVIESYLLALKLF
jgi:hypothetical protein